jgi:hypothetical protein
MASRHVRRAVTGIGVPATNEHASLGAEEAKVVPQSELNVRSDKKKRRRMKRFIVRDKGV